MTTLDDGSGTSLFAANRFIGGGDIPGYTISKWDGTQLSPVGGSLNELVADMVRFDDGTGPAVYASGSFTNAAGGPTLDVAKWDGSIWSPLGNGIGSGFVNGLASFDDGTGASLYAGGQFSSVPDSGDRDLARWGTPVACGPGTAYCLGDGTGTACPCGNNGGLEEGCANSTGQGGAKATGFGDPSFFSDSFGIYVSGARPNTPGLLLLADGHFNQGLGSPAGSGLLCVGGFVQRSQVQVTNSMGASSFFDFQGSAFGATAFGVGAPVHYQFWYRDNASSCSGGPFNFSSAWTATWQH